jgi:drug/metabolite transporter (DMT)-like permease
VDLRDIYTWAAIAVVVIASTTGDVLIALAMQRIGNVERIRRSAGIVGAARAVMSDATIWLGICFMAVGYFSLLVALSWGDVSLVAPASASLTFVTNAVAARIFLHERVDRRRWFAAAFVAAGVALLAQ